MCYFVNIMIYRILSLNLKYFCVLWEKPDHSKAFSVILNNDLKERPTEVWERFGVLPN